MDGARENKIFLRNIFQKKSKTNFGKIKLWKNNSDFDRHFFGGGGFFYYFFPTKFEIILGKSGSVKIFFFKNNKK
jgi:hypothetical protein